MSPAYEIDHGLIERIEGPLAVRLAAFRERLDTAAAHSVQLLAISKGHPVEAAIAAYHLGLTSLGESYAQELAGKIAALELDGPAPAWHFVGNLQRNKVRLVADRVAVWQSVDRLAVGVEIAKRSPGAVVYAQVNLSGDPNKGGCDFDELGALIEGLHELGLRVDGLMGVGTAEDRAATSAGFRRLRSEVDRHGLSVCSMGMTDDLDLAIDAGSTMVRVGTAIFGPRP